MEKKNNWKALIFVFILMILAAVIENTMGIFVPAFKAEFGVDDNSISNMFIINSAAYMLFTYIGGTLSEKIGQKKVYILGIIVSIASLLFLSRANNFAMLLIGLAFASGGVALNAIASNTIIPIIVLTAQTIIMNLMHFFYAVGASGGQALFGQLSGMGIGWKKIYFYLAMIYIIILIVFIFFKMPTKESKKSKNEKIKLNKLLKNPIIIYYMLGLGLYCFAEQGLGSWFTNYVSSSFNLDASTGAMYTAIFFAVFALGRLLGGFVVQKTGYLNTVTVSLILAAILVTIGIMLGESGLIIISLSGIFFAITFPTTVLTVGKVFTEKSSYVTGVVVTAVSFVIMFMNKIMGVLSDEIGAEKSFYLIPISLVLSAILMIILYNRTKDRLVKR